MLVTVLHGGCGDDSPGDSTDAASPDSATDVTTSGDTADAALDGASDTAAPDVAEAGLPNISEVLDCGREPGSGAGNSNELQRYQVDTTLFPDAICNDGSAAVLYFRPYVGEANRDRWLINLNGGGGCGSGPACAARWCWCRDTEGPDGCEFAESTTNFSMGNMNADDRASIGATGIFRRGDPDRENPIGGYNQVRIIYCSSDSWAGTHRAAELEAIHPTTGEPVAFSVHFLGSRILDAVLATLRRDGVASLEYSFGATPQELPDLDDAIEVIVSGDSAGGSGVVANLDRVADTLRQYNTACAGESCPLVVRGLIDAAIGPDMSRLDFSASMVTEFGGSTYDDYLTLLETVIDANHEPVGDTSCDAWHAANAPESAAQCADSTHIIRHHVTTPFFVRMALLDTLISDRYSEGGYADPALGPMNIGTFARVLQRELLAFADLPATAEEGDQMFVAPGVFAPACSKHDTLHSDAEVFETSITPRGGSEMLLFDALRNWVDGVSPSALASASITREDTFCAAE
jgi:hypothetical protein